MASFRADTSPRKRGEPPRRVALIMRDREHDWWEGEGAEERFASIVASCRHSPYAIETWSAVTASPQHWYERIVDELEHA